MSKKNDLRQSLRAANRRRSRRPAPEQDSRNAVSAADASSCQDVDVVGLCVEEILKMHGRREFRDSEVITALRACLSGGVPSTAEAQLLHLRFNAIGQREDVSIRGLREALQSLEKTATEHRTPDDDSAFMQFLSVLAS